MKRILAIALLGALMAGAVGAATDTPGAPAVQRNGYYWNATNGAKTDADGNAYTSEASKDRDYGQVLSTGISATTLVAGSTYFSQLVDLSTYNFATLILTWGTAAAADSDSVNIALRLFNKATDSWATDDAQVAPIIYRASSVTDTSVAGTTLAPLLAQNAASGTHVPAPNLYIYRNTSTMLKATGSAVPLYGLGKVARTRAFNGGIAVDLTSLCGNMKFNYLGFTLSNWGNVTNLTNVKAVLWVSR